MGNVKINRLFGKLERDYPHKVDELDTVERAGEALEMMSIEKDYEQALAFLEVTNNQATIPANFHAVLMIAKNKTANAFSDSSTETSTTLEPETDYPVCLDECGSPISEYNVAYYRPYYDLRYDYGQWYNSSIYQRNYTPVRLSTNLFFGTLVCENENYEDIYQATEWEYTIINNTVLRFNFSEGVVAMAYLRAKTDQSTGYPMLPDSAIHIEAAFRYVVWKDLEFKWMAGMDVERRKIDAERQWGHYHDKALNDGYAPETIDEFENLLRQWNYLIPRRNAYDNFFGNLGRKEVKNILHTETIHESRYGTAARSRTYY